MSTTTLIDIPETAGQLPSDIEDEPMTAPAGITGVMTDATTVEPLPNVTGLTANQMQDRLTDLHRTMAGAVGNWSQAGGESGGKVYFGRTAQGQMMQFASAPTEADLREHSIDRGRVFYIETKPHEAPGEADARSRLVTSEAAALRAADDLRRHALAILAATERAPVTLPTELQESAAARFPLLKGQVDSLPMPELVNRIRAAITSDDAAAMSVYSDLVPSRLDSMPDTASQRDRDAAKDLATLVNSIRSRLHEQYADSAVTDLHKKATEMLIAAGAARRKAGKRGLKQRTLDRQGHAWERMGKGKLLKPVYDANGQQVFDENGAPLMHNYDGSESRFDEQAVEQFYRSRGTLVDKR